METKCWNCKNATGRCSWSKSLKPVEGWNAIPTKIYNGLQNEEPYHYDSYIVKKCPLFEKDKWTINEICKILKISIRTYYRYQKENRLDSVLKKQNISKFDIYKKYSRMENDYD